MSSTPELARDTLGLSEPDGMSRTAGWGLHTV